MYVLDRCAVCGGAWRPEPQLTVSLWRIFPPPNRHGLRGSEDRSPAAAAAETAAVAAAAARERYSAKAAANCGPS